MAYKRSWTWSMIACSGKKHNEDSIHHSPTYYKQAKEIEQASGIEMFVHDYPLEKGSWLQAWNGW